MQRQMLSYVSQMQLVYKVVYTPVVAQCLIPMAFLFETIEIPLLPYTRWSTSVVYWSCDFHSCCVCGDSRAPTAATRGKNRCDQTVEIPRSLLGEKIVAIPEVRTIQGTRTSESFRIRDVGVSIHSFVFEVSVSFDLHVICCDATVRSLDD